MRSPMPYAISSNRCAAAQPLIEELIMHPWIPLLALLATSLVCAYLRTGLRTWTIAGFAAIFIVGVLAGAGAVAVGPYCVFIVGVLAAAGPLAIALTTVLFAALTVPLNIPDFRRRKLTAPLLRVYQKI